jgi:deferrochelatase/peroxidase EfeB
MLKFQEGGRVQAGLFDTAKRYLVGLEIKLSGEYGRDLLALISRSTMTVREEYPSVDIVAGFSAPFWNSTTVPEDGAFDCSESSVFLDASDAFPHSKNDVLFLIKSNDYEACTSIVSFIESKMYDYAESVSVQYCQRKNEGRVLGERFLDGITYPQDWVSIKRFVLNPDANSDGGGSWAITLNFETKVKQLERLSITDLEDVVGRHEHGPILPTQEVNNHIIPNK